MKEKYNSKGEFVSAQKYYLAYRKIKNSYYYAIGNGRYINVRNVAAINGYRNCSNGEKITISVPTYQHGAPLYVMNNVNDKTVKFNSDGTVTVDGKK